MADWIDIKEKTPSVGQWCLVYKISPGPVPTQSFEYEVDCYLNDEEIGNHPEEWRYSDQEHVTHWMPLPPPPTSRKDKFKYDGAWSHKQLIGRLK